MRKFSFILLFTLVYTIVSLEYLQIAASITYTGLNKGRKAIIKAWAGRFTTPCFFFNATLAINALTTSKFPVVSHFCRTLKYPF